MCRIKRYYILNILLLSVLLTTASACDEGALPEMVSPDSAPRDVRTPSTPLEGLPVVNEFYADPVEVTPNDWATLHWNVSEALTVSIEPDIGEVVPSGERGVRPLEDTTYTLTASNEIGSVTARTRVIGYDGPWTGTIPSSTKPTEESGSTEPKATDSPLKLTDQPSSSQSKSLLPIIHSFIADPASIQVGSQTKLRWEVSNADAIKITSATTKAAVSSSGSISVSPSATTIYTLTATNSSGSRSQTATVIVGDSARLALEKVVINDDGGTAEPADFTLMATGPTPVSGIGAIVSNVAPGTYTLSESGPDGYIASDWVCVGGLQTGSSITLGLGESATCTICNDDIPTVKVAKPDLVIIDIWRSGSTQWYYAVKNRGTVGCKESISTLMIDGKNQLSQSIGPLAAGQSREFYFSYKYACGIGTSHTWTVISDAKSYISESEEGNNSRTEKFTCP